jgi:hypothetical protein
MNSTEDARCLGYSRKIRVVKNEDQVRKNCQEECYKLWESAEQVGAGYFITMSFITCRDM